MRTLDEVIAYFDNQTQQRHVYLTEDAEDTYNDALHYLKEYKIKHQMIFTRIQACDNREQRLQEEIALYLEAVKNCEVAETKYRQLAQNLREVGNPALSWEQLKQMEGKPVWVEEYWMTTEDTEADSDKYWAIMYMGLHKILVVNADNNQHLYEYEMGNTTAHQWKAYRKERT